MLPDIAIRRATSADVPAIWALRTRALVRGCRDHYTPELLDAWVQNPMPTGFAAFVAHEPFFVATNGPSLLGFAALKRASAEIDAVFVCPTVARAGLGGRLLAHLEQVARDLGIAHVRLDASLNAVPFYRAAGYTVGPQGAHTAQSGLRIPCVHMDKQLGNATIG